MAPKDAAKALQGNRTRPVSRVVPAIPLPYLQKRKQQTTPSVPATQPVAEEPIVAPVLAPVSATQAPASPLVEDILPNIANESPNPSASIEIENPDTPVTAASPKIQEAIHEVSTPAEPTSTSVSTLEADEPHQTSDVDPASNQETTESRSTYNMPPPFVPASSGHSTSSPVENVQLPQHPSSGNGQQSNHHGHPSNGNVIFGSYPASNNSSPAPPTTMGNLPQDHVRSHPNGGRPNAPYANGHSHNFSNGFAPPVQGTNAGPYPRQDNQVNLNYTAENFARRQMAPFGPSEVYPPPGMNGDNGRFQAYDPSTPHSFQGSQSSAPTDQDIAGQQFYNQYGPNVMNGNGGNFEDVRLYNQPRPKVRSGSQSMQMSQANYVQPNMSQPQMPPNMDNFDGLISYLQRQFADPQFADYTLELRYADDRAQPVRIPGHNLILARSPVLKNLMIEQTQGSQSYGGALREISVQSDDRFLRSDGFWLAVQRLYGGPLLDPGVHANIAAYTAPSQMPPATPGDPADRFSLALGYAAAGRILQMPPVTNRGIEIASHFVNWITLEKALDFALDGGLDSQWTLENNQGGSSPTYGPHVNMLIHNSLHFLITNFPPNFVLDATVPEPSGNHRLPHIVDARPSLPNPRLSSIKFGDHPMEETARSNSNSLTSVLSKVLLNLPYQLLKYVLESSRLGNVHGWATTKLRHEVMHAVVEEREKRRNLTREMRAVSNRERTANIMAWETVGWQESIVASPNGNDAPTLTRTWVDFILSGN